MTLSPEQSNGDDWARVLGALEGSIDQEPGKRWALLQDQLGREPRLLAMAEELLVQDAADDHYLEPPDCDPSMAAAWEQGTEDLPVEQVGPYRLQRLIGRGGMGSVYLAARADGTLHRQVAVKLVPPALGSAEVLARFQLERQVQASLSHVGIATLLDGGATDDGVPYLVMEYVDGERIDRWCNQQRLDIEGRLKLFIKVAKAVSHAHENRVVHRDIKPSNILVNAAGDPKLLDFGIAKLLDSQRPGEELTLEGMQRMTPAYASPEQFRSGEITQAADIYSLGVLLFELLTGHGPQDLVGCSLAEIERVVCEDPPRRPSRVCLLGRELPPSDKRATTTRLDANNLGEMRATTPQALRRALQGDLERIVLVCLRKEPARRYTTADALVTDIELYLDQRPILARPDTMMYRTTRFVQRHRWVLGIASLVVAALSVALVFSLQQYQRALGANSRYASQKVIADKNLAELRRFRRDHLRNLAPVLAEIPGGLVGAERLVALNLDYLDREAETALGDPALMGELVKSYRILGDLQGNPQFSSRGNTAAAMETYAKALKLARRLESEHPSFTEGPEILGKVMIRVGSLLAWSGDHAGASEHFRAVAKLAEDHRAMDPLRMDYLQSSAWSYMVHGAHRVGRFADGLRATQKMGDIVERMIRDYPDQAFFLRGDRCASLQLAGISERMLGNSKAALSLARQGLEGFERLMHSHPTNSNGRFGVASMRTSLGEALIAAGRPDEAEQALLQSLQELQTLADGSPGDARAARWLADQQMSVVDFYLEAGRPAEAEPLLLAAYALIQSLLRLEPDQFLMQRKLAWCEYRRGRLAQSHGDGGEASRWFAASAQRYEELLEEAPPNYHLLRPLISVYQAIGEQAIGDEASHRAESLGAGLPWLERAQGLARQLLERGCDGADLRRAAEGLDARIAQLQR